ncbi:MAG: hypothetical protein ACOCYG_03240, partial [Spirochaetota bacterium]
SEKFQLLRRPYTIDAWDFTSDYDAAITNGDFMDADLEKTTFGVMHGDSTGMADACRRLAVMLRFVDRGDEADEADRFADHLLRRVGEVAWNGEFFTHHVSEDPSFTRDFGVDESAQVSLSNACALNRGISHEKAVSILKTYQRIRKEMPDSSGGEFYMIYPPYERGFHIPKWEYANGGVLPLIAGEIAAGALEHGFEEYGLDVLDRVVAKTDEADLDMIPWGFRGAVAPEPERTFSSVDLRAVANADITCEEGQDGFLGVPGLDIRELGSGVFELDRIPYTILDSAGAGAENPGGACVRLAYNTPGFADRARIEIGRKAESIYFLYTTYGAKGQIGDIDIHYGDGTVARRSVELGVNIASFWAPVRPDRQDRMPCFRTVISWRGKCPGFWNVGLTSHGLDNPHPEKEIDFIELISVGEGKKWIVLSMTTSDAPVYFKPDIVGHGVNIARSAGSLLMALVEGVAGVRDDGANMSRVRIAPRWAAAGIGRSRVCIAYAEGGGYTAYSYEQSDEGLTLEIASTGDKRRIELLLPAGREVESIMVSESGDASQAGLAAESVPFEIVEREESRYACFESNSLSAVTVVARLQAV